MVLSSYSGTRSNITTSVADFKYSSQDQMNFRPVISGKSTLATPTEIQEGDLKIKVDYDIKSRKVTFEPTSGENYEVDLGKIESTLMDARESVKGLVQQFDYDSKVSFINDCLPNLFGVITAFICYPF